MKKHFMRIAALTLFVTTMTVATAHAQNSRNTQMVNIHFDFYAGGQKLPAGEYLVSADASSWLMRIQNREQKAGAYLSIRPVEGVKIPDQSKLVFHKYGEEYFLAQVWTAGRAMGQELDRTNRERQLDRELARRGSKAESVAVIVRAN